MKAQEFKIEGMTCHHCIMAVERELNKIGVDSYTVTIGSAKIKYDEKKINTNDVGNAVKEAGYQVVN